ncbi:MAG TPA: hypothetical protein VJ824_05255 [Bacillota bacterium]|nr:hypothetical protein [Bacillota bacterium]
MLLAAERILTALVFIYLLLIFIGGFILLGSLWLGYLDETFGLLRDYQPIKEYLYFATSGAIGGTLYCLRLFHTHYVRENLNIRRWWMWYVVRPILSAGTAVMMIILFQSGILIFEIGKDLSAKIALAFLSGYGFGKMMDKLETLTMTLFNTNTSEKETKLGS